MTALSPVWINGERQVVGAPQISARDRGFTLADGVFETMRARNGRLFRLDRHMSRLRGALATLEIPAPPELDEWLNAALSSSQTPDGSIRLTVTRGVGPAGVAPTPGLPPTVIIAVNPLPLFPASIYEVGLSAHVASGRRNDQSMTTGLKTLAYTDSVVALLEARKEGAEEALFLDTRGHCSEASSSNLFIWTGKALVTPPDSCAVLPGVTRAAVMELAASLDIPVSMHPFMLRDLLGAQEAFLTSSLRGLAPLTRVNGESIGIGIPGAITRRLSAAYLAVMAKECGG